MTRLVAPRFTPAAANAPSRPPRRAFTGLFGALALLLLAAGLSGAAPVRAELAGLVHDRSDASLRVVGIDSGDGTVTPGSESVDDCCFLGAGLTAADHAGGRFFAYGHYLSGGDFGQAVLLSLDFDGNATTAVAPETAPQGVLAWNPGSGRLISAGFGGDTADPELQWIAIDPVDGSVADIGGPDVTCCELLTGVVAVDAAGEQLFFVGREFDTTDWAIRAVDLGDGTISQVAPLPAPGLAGFMAYDAAGGHIELYMQDGAAGAAGLHRVDVASGTATQVAAELDDGCCLIGAGAVASLDAVGEAWWVAGSGDGLSTVPGFSALLAGSDSASVVQRVLAGDYLLNALAVDGAVVSPALILRDRFEATN